MKNYSGPDYLDDLDKLKELEEKLWTLKEREKSFVNLTLEDIIQRSVTRVFMRDVKKEIKRTKKRMNKYTIFKV